MYMKWSAMHGVCGIFDKAVSNRDKEGDNSGSEFEDVDADIPGATAIAEIRG
jgi:hypothetical protein